MNWVWFILIGVVSGWLAGVLTQGRGFGILGDLVVGVLGALVGGFVFTLLGFQWFGSLGALITSTIGAVILLTVLRVTCRRCPQ
jgi:uncharacterized membrane protein YeaQ/YmgE (transglycosylase-associated protein family)